MKYIVIAQHHGAFLTIEQLSSWGLDFAVAIPQVQIDKYLAMGDDKVFKNFEKNLIKAADGRPVVVINEFNKPIEQSEELVNHFGGDEQTMILMAGALLLAQAEELTVGSRYGLAKARVHPKFKRLYKMIGEPEESNTWWPNAILVDPKKQGGISELARETFWHADPLYAKSFGPLWCMRYRQMVHESIAMSFWMEAIRQTQDANETIAYPYHLYAEYAKKVKRYLPEVTYQNILANGERSAYWADLVALDL